MDLLLTLTTRDDIGAGVTDTDGRVDVLAEVEPGATVGDLAEAIALHLRGGAGGEPVTLSLDGRTALSSEDRVDRTALCDGAYVTVRVGVEQHRTRLVPALPMPAQALATLVFQSGPRTGERIMLNEGATVLGRSRTADVRLDDPSVGRQHSRIVTRAERGSVTVIVTDLGSSNGTLVDGTPVTAPVTLRGRERLTLGTTDLSLEIAAVAPAAPPTPAPRPAVADDAHDEEAAGPGAVVHGVIALNRPPRLHPLYQGLQHTFPRPPERPRRQRLPMIAALAPLVAGLVAYALTRNIASLAIVLVSPLMAVGSQWERRQNGQAGYKDEVRNWLTGLAETDERITAEQQVEATARRAENPEPVLVLARLPDRLGLWTRRPEDPDFGVIRFGLGERPTRQIVKVADGGDPELVKAHLQDASRRHALLSDIPVVGSAIRGCVGIAGPLDPLEDLARWITVQLAVQHSPAELAIAALLPDDHADRWDWLKFLPHTRSASSPVSGPHLAAGATACADLLRRISEGIEAGTPARSTGADRALPVRNLVVLIDGAAPVDLAALTSLMRSGPAAGVGFVWFGTDATALPPPCSTVVTIDDTDRLGDVRWANEPEGCRGVRLEGLELGAAKGVARGLAPLRDATRRADEEDLPSNVLLVDLLGGVDVLREPQRIVDRWTTSRSLRAPIGLTPGEELSVDIVTDGPHGFLVGTTGSGKSELLRSLLLSMAATHSPNRLSLLLIDFKGGAAFLPMLRLPHTVGLVTNLRQGAGGGDAVIEQNVRRALVWLRAELQRRMQLFAEHKVSDLKDLERAGAPGTPPRLVIVADEFAVLARASEGRSGANVIDEMVDIARLGRSLGVHLMLSTQQATGAITPKIQANTNLRIALRLQDAVESQEVVGTKAAAAIPQNRPGRAFLRIGNREAAQLQTASTIGTSLVESSRPPSVQMRTCGTLGRLGPRTEALTHSVPTGTGPEDFAALIDAVRGAASLVSDDGSMLRPPVPWTDPLLDLVALSDLPSPPSAASCVLGLIDDPAAQSHAPAIVDFDRDGSVAIFGGTGSGKTSLLRLVAMTLARHHDADSMHLYGLDFAGRGLSALGVLPQVGAVLSGDDAERVQRLLGGLIDTVKRRAELFAAAGATTLSEYLASGSAKRGDADTARVVVLLDGLHGFAAQFETLDGGKWLNALTQLVVEGRQVGVHLVVAADRRTGAPMALMSAIARKIVLAMSSASEYALLDVKATAFVGTPPPGRGLVDGLEAQFAFPVSASGIERFNGAASTGDVAAMDRVLVEIRTGEAQRAELELDAERARTRSSATAPGVAKLPHLVEASSLPIGHARSTVYVGINDADLTPFALSLETPLIVAGPPRSGKTTTLGTLVRSLDRATSRPRVVLITSRRNPLSSLRWDLQGEGPEAVQEVLTKVLAVPTPPEGIVVFADDVLEFAGTPIEPLLRQLLDRSRTEAISLVASGDIGGLRGAYADWLKTLRSYGRGVLLQPNLDVDGDLLATRLPRRRFDPVTGRGFIVDRGSLALVQVAL